MEYKILLSFVPFVSIFASIFVSIFVSIFIFVVVGSI